MRIGHTRTAAATAALAAAGLTVMALRPAPHATANLAARNPAVEVRTEVIRRTIHVSSRGHGALLARRPAGAVGLARRGATHAGHTRASGSHHWPAPAHSGTVVSTRSSPGHASSAAPSSPARPVTTRPSPGHAAAAPSSSAPRPVSTRSSPGHSGSAPTGGSGRPVSTHTSGSHHGDDGGERGGGDD